MDQAQHGSETPFLIYLQKQNCQSESKEHLCAVFSLHYGILGSISAPFQTSLFGEGTYLTSDLSLALLYSPHGLGWQRSVLGSVLSCIAVCEIIDHPDVKCQVKKKGEPVAVIITCSSSLSTSHISALCIYFTIYKQCSVWSVDTLQQKLAFSIDPSPNAQQPCCL